MTAIDRNVDAARERDYDAIIIGGGIHGVMLLFESVRRGMRALLIEKDDFGGATSRNNLRIVHGGLRYLQTLHLSRHRESVNERRWFLTEFPDLVRPLPCLMPLYGGILRNRTLLRAALIINDRLSRDRNDGVVSRNHLQDGEILGREDARARFPQVRPSGLRGAALWFDAVMLNCQRIIEETVVRACEAGGTALNRVEATDLLQDGDRIAGLAAMNRASGTKIELRARAIINAAGPAVDRVNRKLRLPGPEIFIPSLAWNMLIDREPLADCAVALQSPRRGARVYFSHALDGRMLVGTGHAPLSPDSDSTTVQEQDLQSMIEDLNEAVPALELRRPEVIEVLSGQLPVQRKLTTDLCKTAQIVRHSDHGGPEQAISVSGVKFTTARSTAAKALDRLTENRIL